MASADLRGLWVPIVTPFLHNGDIDLPSLRSLCHHLFDEGVTGIVALGTTGEPATLEIDEQEAVVRTCNEVCTEVGRPFMVGVGTNSTAHTIARATTLSRYSAVSAVLVVVPYYTRPSIDGIVKHFQTIAVNSDHPVVAYNVPYRTGVTMRADDILRLAEIPNVVGIKQAVGALDLETLKLLQDAPSSFQILAGDDALIAPTMLMGGAGAIAAAGHICTRTFVELVAAASAGDVNTARRLAEELLPVVTAGFAEPSPALWKAALHAQNLITSATVRSPLVGSTAQGLRRLLAAVNEFSAVDRGE